MELVTKLDVILMLIGIVGSTAETPSETYVTSPSTISSVERVEPSTQDTTTTKTTMTISGNEQTESQLGTEVTSPSTISSVESSTQDTTTTKTTMTTSGNEQVSFDVINNIKSNIDQEPKKCDDVFIFSGVGVALTIPITVIITLLLIWRRIGVGPLIICTKSDAHYSSVECNVFVKCAQCSRSIRVCWEFLLLSICCCLKSIGTGPRKKELTGSDQVPGIVPDRNGAEQSNNADERDYDQPQWNRIASSVHRQPIGNEMENTEYENVGSCSRSSYEGLHPYENHGMNLYDSCSQEHILQEETEEIGV